MPAPVWLAVPALYLLAGAVEPAMLQLGQILNVLHVASFLGLIAAGQTLALLVAGIDLSQAGVVTLTNILAISLMDGDPAWAVPAILPASPLRRWPVPPTACSSLGCGSARSWPRWR
jgi:ribose transport system permease protein